jgi:two-component system chemotaxis sensor kinase CheA
MLESLLDPLTHLVRNALDHGIEPADRRRDLGKPLEGRIRLQLDRRGDRVEIVLEDDGKGIDSEELRGAAVRQGFITHRNADRLDDDDARLLVTLPGFSTRSEVGSVSGRGIGMDVVRAQVEALGGSLHVASDPGMGTRIELALPVLQAVVPSLLFRSCGELYAVPLERVERTLDLAVADSRVTGRPPLIRIEDLLAGVGGPVDVGTALVLDTVDGPRTIVADEVLGRRELFVRPLDAALRGVPGFEGSALLEDGSVVLVVDPGSLPAAPDIRNS